MGRRASRNRAGDVARLALEENQPGHFLIFCNYSEKLRILTACHCEGASPKQSPHTGIASLRKSARSHIVPNLLRE